jgi:hypothetical protein
VLDARRQMRERLESLGIRDWVESFDLERYNRNATVAENLLFGTPVGRVFDMENLAANAYVRTVLRETGLHELLVRTGHKVAETMVELFSGLPPGHEFFAQYSFINQDDLPQFEAILKRADEVGLKGLDEAETRQLLALPFRLIGRPAPSRPDRRRLRGARDRGAAPLRRPPAREAQRGRSSSSTRSATTPPPRSRTTSCSAASSPARPARWSASPSWCASCSTSSACGRRW